MINRPSHLFSLMALLALGTAAAAGTPAGTQITNQAAATYRDTSGATLNANSNQVSTTIRQVGGLTIVTNGTVTNPGQQQAAVPGAEVVFPYILTNTGNGTDTFTLDVLTDTTQPNSVASGTNTVYIDRNGDGILQPGERVAVTSFTNVAADAPVKFFVVTTVPTTASTGKFINLQPRAVSAFDTTKTDGYAADASYNYARANVSQGAVVSSSKRVNSVTRDANGNVLVNFTIAATNTGTTGATNVVVSDNILSGGSNLPSGSSITSLPAGVNTSTPAQNPTAFSTQPVTLDPGQTREYTFTVTVPRSAAPAAYRNVASVQYAENTNADLDGTAGPDPVLTNQATFTKAAVAGVALGPVNNAAATPELGAPDTQTLASVASGNTVTFTQTIQNTGDATDTFNLAAVLTNLNTNSLTPVVQLLRPDGTPLPDTNNDGVPDTGPVAVNDTVNFLVRLSYPAATQDVAGNRITVTATSLTDSAVTNGTIDQVTTVTGARVAFGDADTSVNGGNPATVVNLNAAPGSTVAFPMEIGNNGAQPDTYNLSGTVSIPTATGTVAVAVVYYLADANGNPTGSPITSTGTVQPNSELKLVAVVTVPANALPGTRPITQTATSPLSGASGTDATDTVTVKNVYDVTLTPDRSGTTTSPGTAIYQHNFTNTGNTAITAGDLTFTTTPSGATLDWTYLYSFDGVNYSATPGAAFTGSLAPGASRTLFVKVNVPVGAATDALNQLAVAAAFSTAASSTVIVNDTPAAPAKVTDTTRVVGGKLSVSKSVKNCLLDAACANPQPGDTALPGELLQYTLLAKNLSTENVDQVILRDTVPAYTRLVGVSGPTNGFYRVNGGTWTSVATALAGGPLAAGTLIEFAADSDGNSRIDPADTLIAPGSSVTFTLTVRID